MRDDDRWDDRIARARRLAGEHPAASDVLTFYAELAGFQKATSRSLEGGEAGGQDAEAIVAAIPALLSFLAQHAPTRLADAAANMRGVGPAEWRSLIERYWNADAHDVPDADEAMMFVVEVLLQPVAEAAARGANEIRGRVADSPTSSGHPNDASDSPRAARCPACSGKPVVSVLREEGQSARRSLVCGLCLTEWPWPRIVCPACGEDVFDKLPVYRSDAFAGARIDACDSCRTYLKTIDLSKDALAIPVVDELAAVPLDLWARAQGYMKLRPNLLRM
jgi:FdhE protein